jgi:hypothetical protein
MGDGIMVAAAGFRVPLHLLGQSSGYYSVYQHVPIREALEWLDHEPTGVAFVPDFKRRAAEIREVAAQDHELAALIEFAEVSARGRGGRRIIT